MADNIKAPSHYVEGRKYEPKDVIRDWGLNFNLGSAVKYISRAGRKGDKLEDLQKAKQFLEFEIEATSEEDDLKHIVQKIDNNELDCIDIPTDLSRNYQEIKDAIERKTSWYTNGIFGQWYLYQNIPDGYKARVIDKIAQEVLDNQYNIDLNLLEYEVHVAVIDRIIEMIGNGELKLKDIPTGLYEECGKIQAAIANRNYCKAMAAVKKYAEDAEDTVSINFEFEVDPEIYTDTINVHVHIKNKEI